MFNVPAHVLFEHFLRVFSQASYWDSNGKSLFALVELGIPIAIIADVLEIKV